MNVLVRVLAFSPCSTAFTKLALALFALGIVSLSNAALAQGTVGVEAKAGSPSVVATVSGPLWSELSPGQQKILQPLAPSWESLEPARKRKWIAVAQTYPQKSPAEQEKLQARMAEWAALSPRERAVARLNFSETKKLPAAANRAANWDAYQALPAEDRQKLAEKAASAPKGAALAAKQSSTDKLTPVPVTRHTPAEQRAAVKAVTPAIDQKTLLPLVTKPVKPVSAPTN